jgi:hypothetical protein
MNKCGLVYDYPLLVQNTSKTFIKKRYKLPFMELMYKTEESLLKLVQEEVAIIAELGRYRGVLIQWVDNSYDQYISNHIKFLPTNEIVKLTMNTEMISRVHSLSNSLFSRKFSGSVIKCTSPNCAGVVYTNTDKNMNTCNICGIYTCLDCYCLIDNSDSTQIPPEVQHTCDNDTVKSIEYIQQNSKNCPKCNIRISMIDGCSQMFCVYCHTAFNWDTLIIYKTLERYNNPHHQQYIKDLRGINRETDCEISVLEDMISEIDTLIKVDDTFKDHFYLRTIIKDFKSIRHIFHSSIRYYNTDYIHEIRKKHISNTIDKSTYLNLYWNYLITIQKNNALQEISDNMFTAVSEIIISTFQEKKHISCDIYRVTNMFQEEFYKTRRLFQ